MADAFKVALYVTSPLGLLVFDEPDYPDLHLQVPGGTVEVGEDAAAAALRELFEETGIRAVPGEARPVGEAVHRFTAVDGARVHHRTFFHVHLTAAPRAEWIHLEETPASGGGPIRLRLHWMALDEARVRLGYGFAAMLDRI